MLATAARDQLPSTTILMDTLPPTFEPVTTLYLRRHGRSSHSFYAEKHVPIIMRTGHCSPYLNAVGPGHSYLSFLQQQGLGLLLAAETRFYADISPLIHVDADLENMVNASMRDESLSRLLSLHRVFYDLSPLAFCKTVALVDNFITRVKVKPKYMMCVAVACYYIVSKFEPKESRPTVESLVRLSRCGGTPEDLVRMVDIILTKLGSAMVTAIGATSATALDFVRAVLCTGSKNQDYSDIPKFFARQIERALCNTTTAFYRPCTIAMALLTACYHVPPPLSTEEFDSQAFRALQLLNVSDLFIITNNCNSSWPDVDSCMRALLDNGTLVSYSVSPVKAPIDSPVWTLSRRTMSKLTAQSPPSLHSISEFQMEDDEE